MQAQLTDARLSLYRPDVLVRPHLEGVDLTSFRRLEYAVRAGEDAATADLARLRALLGTYGMDPAADMLPGEEGDA
jgi:NTE family protein